jgi:hypothetical protein
MRLLRSALFLALLAAPPAFAESVTQAVFDARLLADVKEPATFHYRFELRGESIEEPYSSPAVMEVREIAPSGEKQVFFDLFEGEARRTFGPQTATSLNPLVLVFLQFDVNEMGNLTGGSPGYFQQQIRKAFNEEGLTDKISVEIDGRTVEAVRVRMQPFHDDPNIERFPAFRDKTYEFVVADGVPGGLVRIAASTADPKTGDIVIEKSLTFERVDP